MDLRQYYEAIQQLEDTIEHDDVVVVSAATGDGGRAGILSEVNRHTAAFLIVEGKASLATTVQVHFFSLRRQGPTAHTTVPRSDSPDVATTNHIPDAPRTRKR